MTHHLLLALAIIAAIFGSCWFGYKIARGGKHFRESVRRQQDLDG